MKSINPATGELIHEYPEHTQAEVESALSAAEAAFAQWCKRPIEQRAVLMHAAAQILRQCRGNLATLMTREMGKTIASAEAEVDKCATTCDYYADNAAAMLRTEPKPSDATRSYVRYDPLGPVLAVMPWNFPLWQVFRFAAPALMAGNVGILKHASNVSGCALAIAEVLRAAGFPKGVFAALLISSARAQALVDHPVVRAVTLTGSERAGRALASAAGRALKKSVMELGGSDPFIILADADVDATADAATAARCINNGQSCIAAKRFIVAESIAPRFEQALANRMSRLRVGDPFDRNNAMGPLARDDLRDNLHDQVQRTVAAGARLLAGGRIIEGRGYYYQPTVLVGVMPGMPAFDEETFGPVAAVIRAKGVDDAIALANRSFFGLGASVWTHDIALAERIAAGLESGNVFVNGPVKSDPRLPFGGVKNSGYGRELSEFGIHEFVNIKTVWITEGQKRHTPQRSE